MSNIGTGKQNPRVVYRATLSCFPPSANRMYIYTRRGPVASKEMRRFKNQAKVQLAQQSLTSQASVVNNVPYRLVIEVYLPTLYNKHWPKTKTKYKRRDVSNLIKVTEDLVAECLGVDDSCFLEVTAKKLHGPDYDFEGIKVRLEDFTDENKES
ncbi:MAG: hypothetical protein CMA70_04780 [Euryarchaeota archaeon]|nr:hypothetical protein [Euryarchaeota archaeon]